MLVDDVVVVLAVSQEPEAIDLERPLVCEEKDGGQVFPRALPKAFTLSEASLEAALLGPYHLEFHRPEQPEADLPAPKEPVLRWDHSRPAIAPEL